MKQIRISFNMISVIALLALTAGCATTTSTQSTESMLVASGFKVVTPKTPAQQQKLLKLPPAKWPRSTKPGKPTTFFRTQLITRPMSVGLNNTRRTNNSAWKINLRSRISKPLRCTRIQ